MVAYLSGLRNRMVALTMVEMEVDKRIVLAASPEDAWAVVIDFASWFCDRAYRAEIRPGARIEFAWSDGTARAAVLEDVDTPRFLAFRWLPFARDEHGEAVARPQARVEITLSPIDGGVELHVIERRMDGVLAGAIA